MKLAIYLPAYNAAETLPSVLNRLSPAMKASASQILVVDNHSADETEKVTLDYKKNSGLANLHVLRMPRNLGYGGSQKIAYRYCIENGMDVVAMLHSDGQYQPEILGDLLNPVYKNQSDMVFGSRITGDPRKGGMPLHRYLGNRVLTFAQNLCLRSGLSEFHSGYRIFRVDALKKLPFEHLSDDYHFDTEMLILHIDKGLRILEAPIPTYYGSEKNYVNIWKYGMQVLVTTFTYALHKRGFRRSENWARIFEGVSAQDRSRFLLELMNEGSFDGRKKMIMGIPPLSERQFSNGEHS